MREWGFGWENLPRPILISGPCSAETLEQTLVSCQGAADAGAQMLRAGIWKPRTRPDSFEGVGKVGLAWIKAAAQQTGLPVTVEVATAEHVEAALEAGIDVLWLGARTTVNPFSVQALADALRGVDIPVMVKNPINPDVELWIGAFERLSKVGIRRMAAIHRGFSVKPAAPYRNRPRWEIPIDLRRRLEGLEIINDPSHICGNRTLLQEVAQKAMDLNFDGLMIESHCNPDAAWSDAKQQITGAQLTALMQSLIIRRPAAETHHEIEQLGGFRDQIDALDAEIIALLGKRMEVSRDLGSFKKQHHIAILQIERWRSLFQDCTREMTDTGLTPAFIKAYLDELHLESIRQQTRIMNLPNDIALPQNIHRDGV